jgi:hypothetical protein
MKKKLSIALFFLLPMKFLFAQDYMDKILEKTCNCAESLPDTLTTDRFNILLGTCMIEASMPYKKQIKKDYNINMDNVETEGERLGRMIGLKMAAYCPDMLAKLAKRAKGKNEYATDESVNGTITKIEKDPFVIFSVKDDQGKITKLYWLKFIQSDTELVENYESLLDKSVKIVYRQEEYFDPKIAQYRLFKIIKSLMRY